MANITATEARKGFFELIKATVNKHEVFHIHHRQGDAVLLSEAEYESLQETLELLSIPGFRESIARSMKNVEEGDVYSMNDVFGEEK